jgi:hypothetical protein
VKTSKEKEATTLRTTPKPCRKAPRRAGVEQSHDRPLEEGEILRGEKGISTRFSTKLLRSTRLTIVNTSGTAAKRL